MRLQNRNDPRQAATIIAFSMTSCLWQPNLTRSFSPVTECPMSRISVQLYSAREFDLNSVLHHIGELGISEVEGFGGLYGDTEGLRARLDAKRATHVDRAF